MQVNKVGIFLIALFGLLGIAFLVVPISGVAGGTFKLIGAIWLGVAALLVVYLRREKKKAEHNDWIFQQGLRGRATVVEASSNGTLNEMPIMKLVLDLEIPGHEARRANRTETMPVFTATRMQPGLVLGVFVSPSDPSDYILVW
jgi:hypothetical protein